MGLEERLKNKLNNVNLYELKKDVTKSECLNKDIEYSDNPVNKIKTSLISKIHKTPYWNEFDKVKQQKLILSYLQSKLSNKSVLTKDINQTEFVESVMNNL